MYNLKFKYIAIALLVSLSACKKEHPINEAGFSGDARMNSYLYEYVTALKAFPAKKLKAVMKTKVHLLEDGTGILTFDTNYKKNSTSCKVWARISKEKKPLGFYTQYCAVNLDPKNNFVPMALVKTHDNFPKQLTIETFEEYTKPLFEVKKLRGKYDRDILPLMSKVNVVLNAQKRSGDIDQDEYDKQVKAVTKEIGVTQYKWQSNTALARNEVIKVNMIYQNLLKEVSKMTVQEQEEYKSNNFKKFNDELSKRIKKKEA